MRVSEPVNRWIAAGVVALAGLGALLVFGLEAKPEIDEWSGALIAMACVFAVVLVGFVLLALGKTGPEVTSPETDHVIANRYVRLRRKLRPVGAAIALAVLAHAAYVVWTWPGNA